MAQYNVEFTTTIEVEADNPEAAYEIAEIEFSESMRECGSEIFESHVEEIQW